LNDVATEGLFAGAAALKSLRGTARRKVFTLFPGLAQSEQVSLPVLPLVHGKAQKQLIARHRKNERCLFTLDAFQKLSLHGDVLSPLQ